MLLYSLQLSNGSPLHPNPIVICLQPELSLSHTLPSWGSKWALFLTHKHATLVPVWTCSSFQDLHMESPSWFGVPLTPFSWPLLPKLLLYLPHWSSHIPMHCLQELLVLYYYFIIYWFTCSCLGFPTGLWALERQSSFLFPLLLTSVCPVPVHNRQWMDPRIKVHIQSLIRVHDYVSSSSSSQRVSAVSIHLVFGVLGASWDIHLCICLSPKHLSSSSWAYLCQARGHSELYLWPICLSSPCPTSVY